MKHSDKFLDKEFLEEATKKRDETINNLKIIRGKRNREIEEIMESRELRKLTKEEWE